MSLMRNWNPRFGDVYFSPDNGLNESRHVFLNGNRLSSRLETALSRGDGEFCIVEAGFGSGLNIYASAVEALRHGTAGRFLSYSVEAHPLTPGQCADLLAPFAHDLPPLESMLERYSMPEPGWNSYALAERGGLSMELELFAGDILDFLADLSRRFAESGRRAHALYLDGHSPRRNPRMWSDGVFSGLAELCAEDCSFATYSASGAVKRGLGKAGFIVRREAGYGEKRHMIRGEYRG